jgi:hypothetical protein
MKKKDTKLDEWTPIVRGGFVFLGLLLIGKGLLALLRGKLNYYNYWDDPVFAPYDIFAGILLLVGVFLHRKRSNKHLSG